MPRNKTIHSATIGTVVRAVGCICIFVAWFAVSMRGCSRSTSWEHHPNGGVFVMLHTCDLAGDYIISIGVLALIVLLTLVYVIRGKMWALAAAFALSLLTVLFSRFGAGAASV